MKISDIKLGSNYSRSFGTGAVDELAESFQEYGQLQAVLVDADGILVSGFRRYAAAKKLGWTDIKADIVSGSSGAVNLVENLQREDLSLWDQINGIHTVFGPDPSYAEICRALSKSMTWVKPRVDVWKLDEKVIEGVKLGKYDIGYIKRELRGRKGQSVSQKVFGKPTENEVRDMVTRLLERGREDEARALSFAVGSVTREDLLQ